MNTETRAVTPWHFWVIGAVALLWNSGGAISYTATELGALEGMEMPAEQIAYFYSFPAWATAFWALGVWGCLFGSIALLLRSKWAVVLYGISIIGLFGTTYFQWVVSDMPDSLATTGQVLFAAAIWLITFALFFYSRAMTAKGVLR